LVSKKKDSLFGPKIQNANAEWKLKKELVVLTRILRRELPSGQFIS
jgi:hypothetical protein